MGGLGQAGVARERWVVRLGVSGQGWGCVGGKAGVGVWEGRHMTLTKASTTTTKATRNDNKDK